MPFRANVIHIVVPDSATLLSYNARRTGRGVMLLHVRIHVILQRSQPLHRLLA
jgi:hypothetical protein